MQFIDQFDLLRIRDKFKSACSVFYESYFTYIQTLELRIELEFRCYSDRWTEMYQNKPLNTQCYVSRHFQIDLKRY